MIDRSYYVYAHYQPFKSAPFYIGKGKGYRATTWTSRPKEWVDEAINGLEVVLVKENMPEACAYTLEKILICTMPRDLLVNKTMGGGGPSGCKQTPESNKKRSEALKGDKHPFFGRKLPEHIRQALIKANTGSKHSEDHKQKIRENQSGKKHAQFDWNLYEFTHEVHGTVVCLRSELIENYNLSASKVSNLINGRRKNHMGWRMSGKSIPANEKEVRNYKKTKP